MMVVDIIAQDTKELAAYRSAYQDYKESERRLSDMKSRFPKRKKMKNSCVFKFNELDNAGLIEGRQEELEQESETLSHSEDIKNSFLRG